LEPSFERARQAYRAVYYHRNNAGCNGVGRNSKFADGRLFNAR